MQSEEQAVLKLARPVTSLLIWSLDSEHREDGARCVQTLIDIKNVMWACGVQFCFSAKYHSNREGRIKQISLITIIHVSTFRKYLTSKSYIRSMYQLLVLALNDV